MTAQPARSSSIPVEPSSDDAYLEEFGYKPELSRVLGRFASFAIQYSTVAMIGGLVAVFGLGLGQVGPLLLWVWIIGGALQMIIALCAAESCSAYPLAGGAYNIVSRLSSRGLGWMTGWLLEVAHIVSVTASSVAIAPVVASWFGFEELSTLGTIGFCAGLIVLSTLVNIFGVRMAALFNNLGVVAELIAIAVLILGAGGVLLFGHHHVNPASTLFHSGGQVQGSLVVALFFSSLVTIFVLNGFDVSGTAGEEIKDARRTVPLGMIWANLGSYVLGGFGILLLLLAVTDIPGAVNSSQPVTTILRPVLGDNIAVSFEVLAVISLWVNNFILQLAGARVRWAQARDGELPFAHFLAKVDRHKVPVNAILTCAVISFLLCLWSNLLTVLAALNATLWQVGYGVLVGTVFLAKTRGTMGSSAIRVWAWRILYPLGVAWSVFIVGVMIYQDPAHVGLGIVGAVVIGLAIYRFVVLPRRSDGDDELALHRPPAGHSSAT